MASGTAKTMMEEATCPICLHVITEPVIIINCGHLYCLSCILQNIAIQKLQSRTRETFQCPVCRTSFRREGIRPSKQLENIFVTIKKMQQEHLCEKHKDNLSLFCKDDGHLICRHCVGTPQHKGHTTVPDTHAFQEYKEIFQEKLTYLRKQEDQNKEWQGNIREQLRNFQSDILSKEDCIKYRFKVLHMILQMEEQSYLRRLENEKDKVLKRLKDSEAKLEKQSQELKKHIQELERKCQGSAQELLQDARDTLNRISAMKLNAPEDVSLDIHVMPNVDRIFCELLKLFETDYVKITVDPDTAHIDLLVENNGIMVTGGSPQVKPDTPARFKDLPCILGCEAITSGKHYLGMFYINGSMWDVGVCLENVSRDNDKIRDPESGFWAIRHCEDDNSVALMSPITPLNLQQAIHFIGVFLDYEAGLVSFYDLETCSHIFTFPKASFSEPIRPYFCISENTFLDINDPFQGGSGSTAVGHLSCIQPAQRSQVPSHSPNLRS